MIDRLIDKCVSFMIQKGAVADGQEQREIYAYGMELQIYYCINAVVLLTIGLAFGRAEEVLLLLFLFGLIQSNGGGYHAETHGRCLLIMIGGVFLFLFLLPLYQANVFLQGASVLFGASAVMALAPAAHKNHPLSHQKSKRMGRRAKALAGVLVFIWMILVLTNDSFLEIAGVIALTMIFTGVSMLCARIKRDS